jgi:LysM repeat protein
MSYRLFLMSLLSGGLLVSCQGNKAGGGGEDLLADNGGYSEGGFYGDSSQPAPAGYPRDGEDFTTGGGVPFGHNDPIDDFEPAVAVATPRPAPVVPAVASRPVVADAYRTAYADADAYGSDPGAEQAVVTPYVERAPAVAAASPAAAEPAARTTAATGVAAKKKPAVATTGGPRPKPPGRPNAGPAKKPAATVAATTRGTGPGAKKVSGTKTGTTVKTVYTPPGKGKGKTSRKEAATMVRVHDIKRGDTLSKLATRYGVTVAHLKKRNGLAGDTIVLGKRLTID